jgi:uncharacterized protein YkuJ
MALSINFPDLRVPDEAPIYATERADWDERAVAELARRLDVDGDVVDSGLWFVVRDRRAALEVYRASDSYRFDRIDAVGEIRDGDEHGLDANRVVAIAEDWIHEFGPRARWELHSLTEQEVLVSEGRGTEPRRLVAGTQVNYRLWLEELPLLGPGAKMQVAVGNDGAITAAYRFWREARPVGAVPIIARDVAFERFASSNLFADLNDETASADVEEVHLGYLTLPPTEVQPVLLPVYELRGVLATELHPRYEFVSHVAATEIDEGTLKQAQMRSTPPNIPVA